MTEYWLDYSAAKLSGTTIRNAGYTGVIRYIDNPAKPYGLKTKHTDLNEYRSHVAAGLKVYLVMQTTTTASDGGYPVGQDHARRALAGSNYLGYGGPIFFTNDRTTVPSPAAWRAYLDGAASVLGIGRTGAYGFANAMDLAVGHASFFWQAGRRSDVRSHVHVWQDNNTQVTVGGITCDRNLVLKEITGDEDMSMYDKVVWTLADGTKVEKTHSQLLAELYSAHLLTELAPRGETVHEAIWANRDQVGEVRAKVDSISLSGVDVQALASVISEAVTQRVSSADIAEALVPLLPQPPTAEQVAGKVLDQLPPALADVLSKRLAE